MADRPVDTAWKTLENLGGKSESFTLRELFSRDPERPATMSVELDGLLYDYSRQRITSEVRSALVNLARASGLQAEIKRLMGGERLNGTEGRGVGHTLLRQPPRHRTPEVAEMFRRLTSLAESLRAGTMLGATGRPIRSLLHLGIGGSDLGPRMAVHALGHAKDFAVDVLFVANVDGDDLIPRLRGLDPETTLVCVASKSFTTAETLLNAATVRGWLKSALGEHNMAPHWMAITASPHRARDWGIPSERILPMWDWVGGRFSLSSAVGFPLMAAVGPAAFGEFLAGMHAVDEHFSSAPMEVNIPVLMGLLGIWNGNILKAATHAVVPYCEGLQWFPLFLQQLEMESNGKSVTRSGNPIERDSAPVIWGGVGTNAQHAFFQHLHQGTRWTPCDFIGFARPGYEGAPVAHQNHLLANLLAQASALAFGRTEEESRREGVSESQLPWRTFPGNRPSSVLLMDRLTPFNLGRLVALYEHKVFVQGVIWDLYSFDQWGVELGKNIAGNVMADLEGDKNSVQDRATRRLLDWIAADRN